MPFNNNPDDDDYSYGDDEQYEDEEQDDEFSKPGDRSSNIRSNVKPYGGTSGLPGSSRYDSSGSSRFGSTSGGGGSAGSGGSSISRDDVNKRSSGGPFYTSSGGGGSSQTSGGGNPPYTNNPQRTSSSNPSGASQTSGGANPQRTSGGSSSGSGGTSGSSQSGGSSSHSYRSGSGYGSGSSSNYANPQRTGGTGNLGSGGGGASSGARPQTTSGASDAKKTDEKKTDDKDKKPDNKKDGGGLSAFGARMGGLLKRGDDKDKKPDDKKPSDKKPDAKKPDDKKDGGFLGNITARASSLPAVGGFLSRSGADDKDKKPDDKKPAASGEEKKSLLGGIRNPFAGGDKKADDKDKKPDDRKPATPSSGGMGSGSGMAGTGSPYRPGSMGGSTSSSSASSSSASKTSGTPAFGAAGGGIGGAKPADKPAQPKGTAAKEENKGGFLSRFTLPFGGAKAGAPAAKDKDGRASKTKAAASKPVEFKNEGLSLDAKLDILGVALVFSAMILFFSAVSSDQGALTGQINGFFTRLLGWGALAVPVAMLITGGWLIARRFGDSAPILYVQRIVGILMLYIGLLLAFHYIESLNPIYDGNIDFFRYYGHNSARGGGYIGTELYLFVVGFIGELGGVFLLLGWFIVALMFVTRTSAAELAMIIISLYRSFQIARKHRAQRVAAERMLAQQKMAEQLAISKANTPELPAGAPAALPAPLQQQIPLPIESRGIPIRMGGQMLPTDAQADPAQLPTSVAPNARAVRVKGDGRLNKIMNVLPRRSDAGESAPATSNGGGLGRFMRRTPSAPTTEHKPNAAAGLAGAAASAVSGAIDALTPDKPAAPAASTAPPPPPPSLPGVPAATHTMPTPATPTPPAGAGGAKTDEVDPSFMRPAQPKGIYTHTESASATPPGTANGEHGTPPAPSANDRLSRLDQIRAGMVRPGATAPPTAPTSHPEAGVERPTPPQPITLPTAPPVTPPVAPQPPAASQPTVTAHSTRQRKQYIIPDYKAVLSSGSEQDIDRETLVKKARVIEDTLQSFGAPGRVVEINTGPVITQFGVEPDYLTLRNGKKARVKVSSIAQLDKDLQLSLNAKSIRIEAPVPGKGFVGIEVPNDVSAIVNLRDVMESREFKRVKSPLAITLGQSVDGAPVAADLASMPHLLIAGTTGSGKSVCVNAVIISLILNNSPEVVKFIMVDPKRVELTGYNGIPHLVAPVVVELERVVGVLKWVTREMDERYKRFSNAGARNIVDYNNHLPDGAEIMPYIVVIIDELADLMMLAPDETERTITRIAALARATGIHLVIATQRPSVDVVTGLIKANFPARIAFAVASGIDSRVILDQPGAEKLLGRGDMLYMSGDSPAPLRLQGVYVSDSEINNVVRYWRTQGDATQKPLIITGDESSDPVRESTPVTLPPVRETSRAPAPTPTRAPALWDEFEDEDDDLPSGAHGQEDEMYEEAVELVRRLNKASVSLLQRRLRIGYTRAARLIDVMEQRGVVGPPTEGSKPRVVLPPKD